MKTSLSALPRKSLACLLAFIPVIFVGAYAIVRSGEKAMFPKDLVESLTVFAISVGLLILYWIKVRHWLKWVGLVFVLITAGMIVKQVFQVFL